MVINQLPIFKELTPYGCIDECNRWVRLAQIVPWDEMTHIYLSCFSRCKHKVIKPSRLILGLLIGQMMMRLADEGILEFFHENPYFQYFCGEETFIPKQEGKRICHASLLSKRRKRLGKDFTAEFERQVLEVLKRLGLVKGDKLVLDATVFCSNITYPNDVKLLNKVRETACVWILRIKNLIEPQRKVRTYRKKARSCYLSYSKKRKKTRQFIRKSTKKMIQFATRNVSQLDVLISEFKSVFPDISCIDQKTLCKLEEMLVVSKTIIAQQSERYYTKARRIPDRIVSFHQPQARPIVRGKDGKAVEIGAKSQIARVDGFALLDDCEYGAFNEGIRLISSLEKHESRFDRLPSEISADGLYSNRSNRAFLTEKGIQHSWPDIGRPHKHPNEAIKKHKAATRKRQRRRNAIEGLFGTLKDYGNLGKLKWTVPGGETMQIQLGLTTFNLNKALSMV